MEDRSGRTAPRLVLLAFVCQVLNLLLLPDGNRGWLYSNFTFLIDRGKCGWDGPPLFLLGLSGSVLSGVLAIVGYRTTRNRWTKTLAVVAVVVALVLTLGWALHWFWHGCTAD